MRMITKHIPLTIALFGSLAATQVASADLSANFGLASQYVFRGILQTPASASASAGLDYSNSGFYAGTWAGGVELGLEYDLYAGYGGEYSGLSYDVNYTTYNYTDTTWDDTYAEFNINLGYGPVSLGYADGTHDIVGGGTEDYTVTTVSASHSGFTLLYGDNGKDFTGSWYELGYSTDVGEFEAGINMIKSDKDLDDTEYLIFSLGKSIDL